jgi:hypothetical protein
MLHRMGQSLKGRTWRQIGVPCHRRRGVGVDGLTFQPVIEVGPAGNVMDLPSVRP